MDLGLDNRVAVVTGASQGLGLAVARGLAAEGANLVLNARSETPLEAAAEAIRSDFGVDVTTVAGDVRDQALPGHLVEAALEGHDRLDILVTNSGGPPKGHHDEIDAADIAAGLELTVGAAMRLILGVLSPMKEAGWGRIVAVTSMSAKQPIPGLTLSNVTRPGLVGFIKTLSAEVARDGILCNAIAPGWTATPPVSRWIEGAPPETEARLLSEIPLGRLADPGEIADTAVYLASERASYLTGQVVSVDGGYVRGLF
jgi:3-oxoacyl-[acyl-carrier protein] reductase